MNELSLRVSGLTCAACATGLTRYLSKQSGIRTANASYTNATLFLEYDPDIISDFSQIDSLIRKAGFRIPAERVTLACHGMEDGRRMDTCVHALERVFGVKSVSLDEAEATLLVEVWPIGLSTKELTAILRKEGANASVVKVEGGEEEQEQLQQVHMLRRLCAAVLLTMPLMWNPSPALQFVLATAVQFFPGRFFYRGAWQSVRSRCLNMDFLVAASTTLIYLYSTYLAWTVRSDIQLYFLSQCVLLCLILFGKYMELVARGVTARSIRGLLNLQPDEAVIERDGREIRISVSEIREYDVVVLHAGDRVPADGRILSGDCLIDESMLTGESVPVHKKPGDRITAGTLNRSGGIRAIATSVGKDTVLQKIIRTVRKAQLSKAPIQDYADKIAARFIPAVLFAAAGIFCVWYFALTDHEFEKSILISCGVLVVACPCALGLATPTGMIVGMGRAAELGVLFRSAADLEKLCKVNTFIFDKTGTLTCGTLHIAKAIFFDEEKEEQLLQMIAALERYSSHPAAVAIADFCSAKGNGTLPISVDSFTEQVGYGVSGCVKGHNILCGSRTYLENQGINLLRSFESDHFPESEYTEIYASVDGKLAGIFELSDQLREGASQVIQELQARGIEVWMLSGDREKAARAIGTQSGISHILWEVRPEGKAEQLRNLQKEGKIVAMAGDGINDAPALAYADVSIAMGNGTDIAMDTAGIMLPGGRLEAIPTAIDLSAQVMRNIRQNLIWALAYNSICIPLAACGIMNPSIAAAAMSASSISVLLHALRLQKFTPKKQ